MHVYSPLVITTDRYILKLADSLKEIQKALRLRYEVFNLELHEGLSSSSDVGFDSDVFDTFCDHLIVIEKSTRAVVGTYRLLITAKAMKHIGFYSEGEFDLHSLKMLDGNSLELGRSCVAKAHRSSTVINLLWSGISRYVELFQVSRLFGCASLHTKDLQQVAMIAEYLRANHYSAEQFRIAPQPQCMLHLPAVNAETFAAFNAFHHLPPLLKGYLRLGAVVCGEPAYDKEFGTVDFFILVEKERITDRYRNHYLSPAESVAA
ncbi:MAG: GNAT family N-acyltransferase [Bacteroidota bacterium]